jgi:hypothetical protein
MNVTGSLVLVLATSWQMERFNRANIFSADGLFSVIEHRNMQVFTLLGNEDGLTLPLCYFILEDKSEKSYETALDLLRSKSSRTSDPEYIFVDFEVALFKAFKKK